MTEPAAGVAPGVVYVLETADRPGIAHAIAAVFAHRGLSMRALVADTSRASPRFVILFRGTPRQARLVGRVLSRLHDVHSVRMLAEDAEELRAMAVCHPTGDWPALAEIDVQAIGATRVLYGRHSAVEAALAQLVEAGLATEVSRSLVAI